MGKFVDAERDVDDLASLVNESGLFTTRYGDNPKKSWKYMESEFDTMLSTLQAGGESQITVIVNDLESSGEAQLTPLLAGIQSDGDNAISDFNDLGSAAIGSFNNSAFISLDNFNESAEEAINSLNESRGFTPAGTFEDGFIYSNISSVGLAQDGKTYYRYIGSTSNLPVTVAAGTIPESNPELYESITLNEAVNVITSGGENLESFYDYASSSILAENTNKIVVSSLGNDEEAASSKVIKNGRAQFLKPFKTIYAAKSASSAGDLIYIKRGNYTESVDLSGAVDFYAELGVNIVNCEFEVTSNNEFKFLGYANIFETDKANETFKLTDSGGARFNFNNIFNADAESPNASTFRFTRSPGFYINLNKGRSNSRSLFYCDDVWSGVYDDSVIKANELYNDSITQTLTSLSQVLVAAVRGARVSVYCDKVTSDKNAIFAIGTLSGSNPSEETETTITINGGKFYGQELVRFFGSSNSNVVNKIICKGNPTTETTSLANWHLNQGGSNIVVFGSLYSIDTAPSFATLSVDGLTEISIDKPEVSKPLIEEQGDNLTISSGEITLPSTGVAFKVDTEGAAATDELHTINGGVDGQVIQLSALSITRATTYQHEVGNITLGDAGVDITPPTSRTKLRFRYEANLNIWYLLSVSPI